MAQYNITIDSEILYYHFVKRTKDEKLCKLLESVLNQMVGSMLIVVYNCRYFNSNRLK